MTSTLPKRNATHRPRRKPARRTANGSVEPTKAADLIELVELDEMPESPEPPRVADRAEPDATAEAETPVESPDLVELDEMPEAVEAPRPSGPNRSRWP